MVQVNIPEREIVVKVVYYGPALSGKTTNLQMLHELLSEDRRGRMVTLDTQGDRTLYFDFLPIEFGTENGFSVKLKLFKGSCAVTSRKSPVSLYREDLASFGRAATYDHADANGFIRLFGLPIRAAAAMAGKDPTSQQAVSKLTEEVVEAGAL